MADRTYEIHIKNHLDEGWMHWFQAERYEQLEGGITVMVIRVPDKPALHGILEKIRDLNIDLISINEITP